MDILAQKIYKVNLFYLNFYGRLGYMITVIIAGGSGSRLWPLSTTHYPKHLLTLVGHQSLLQGTYARAKHLSETVYVVTTAGHAKHVREQLPELKEDAFIIEPDRRDTSGCFVVALHHIKSRHNHDEPIAFMHGDHYIRDIEGFIQSFKIAEDVSKDQQCIALVGIEPTYPGTGFGYIKRSGAINVQAAAYKVASFKEKPDFKTAQAYVRSGQYFWNAGYFVGSVDVFLQAMEQDAPALKENYDRLLATKDLESYTNVFLSFEKIAIDYALLERAKHLVVVPATFDWMDIGSFADIHKVVETDQTGNYTKGLVELDGVENSYIRNDDDRPVAVIGLDNVVVVSTPHGVLVVRKDLSQQVKGVAEKIQKSAHPQTQ